MSARTPFPHEFAALDPSVRREIVRLGAADGWPLTAALYLPRSGIPT
jgi:hypothetical protein